MTAPATAPPLLDVVGLRVTYGGVVAVSDVDLKVAEGSVYGLIGPNGAGKTSMVDALTGYTRAAAGQIVFDGHDPAVGDAQAGDVKQRRCGGRCAGRCGHDSPSVLTKDPPRQTTLTS